MWHILFSYLNYHAGMETVDGPVVTKIIIDVVGVAFAIKTIRKYEQIGLFNGVAFTRLHLETLKDIWDVYTKKIKSTRKHLTPEQSARQYIQNFLTLRLYPLYWESYAGLNRVDVPTFYNILFDFMGIKFTIKTSQKHEQMELFA